MASTLILINGLPGAGKSTLARHLGRELDVPVVSKDALKESFADITLGRVNSTDLGRMASETMWELAAAITGIAVVESWWYRPRDLEFVTAGASRSDDPTVIELWCDISPVLAWTRYSQRNRHEIHPAADGVQRNWEAWSASAIPLGIGRTVRVDTSSTIDAAAMAALTATCRDY